MPVPEVEAVELFESVLALHGDALKGYLGGLVGRGPEAEDLLQETLLRAWRHPSALDGSKGSVRAWLFSVAHNAAVDHWRRQSRSHPPTDLRDGYPPAGDLADRVVEEAMVSVALESLSDDHRRVLLHAVWLDQPVARISEDLGIPPGTVKSRVHYGLKALRLALEEMGYLA